MRQQGRRDRRRTGLVAVVVGLLGCVPGCSSAGSGPQPATSGAWALAASDEFDGTTLDTSRWRANRYGGTSVDAPFQLDTEAAAYAPEQVRVRDGHLVLSVARASVEAGGRAWSLTSGTVSGDGGMALRDGDLVEARILVPRTTGLWPAFWAVTSQTWPPEIDGFEYFDAGEQPLPQFNYHRLDGTQSGPTSYGEPGADYRGEWHVYGWQRTGGVLTPSLDGRPYPAAGAQEVDTREYFPVLNLAVRTGADPAAVVGASMQVDWIRVWSPR